MGDLRQGYVEQIRRDGATVSEALAGAFATVPREAFVADGFQRRDGTWVVPGDPDFLPTVYTDEVLVTKVDGRIPVSSSSQPSLMAIMLESLDVRPGARVLEIGAGTGYNAALLASLGAVVTSVDVQEDVADRARAALARTGISGVRVVHGDGYAGAPGYRFDRVVVTVGVAGLSPHWLAQLEPDGLAVVPVEHAGTHPVLAARGPADGPVTARVICPSGFMSAAGPLTAAHPHTHPAPATAGTLPGFTPVARPRWKRPLDALAYRDLWYAAGVWHRRATHAAVPGSEHSCLALLDADRTGGAAILPDGSVLAGGPSADRFAADAADLLDRWIAAGRPAMQSWTIDMDLAGQDDAPIWAPARWTLDPR
ncbi:protein-L-isoaspartate O-methyltransferase family protein [Jidongwangia harbinensis]|uniref:protein-L-isoaspartate O-methyltransferase family protein n=1 Tax=Jidongwangia harbinensis TaxID=2878561 RepID=UPI001CD9A79A|nr:methyltransferase domain-containing protein [Jidongwangia harbinensis]MCA2214784.1 methyltransferase domain-containing protein [Jidongwangia harbinensis]